MKKRFFSVLLCLCLLAGLAPNMGTTAYAAGLPLGTTVEFAGHEWYIIGTDDEADGGVTAPAGCYTLLAKDNEFSSTTFREAQSGDGQQESSVYYKDSDLQKKMVEIANNLSGEDKKNIEPRTLVAGDSDISGDSVDNQYLWPLSTDEVMTLWRLNENLTSFEVDFWLRSAEWKWSSITGTSNWSVYFWRNQTPYFVSIENNFECTIRPALYVKREVIDVPVFIKHPQDQIVDENGTASFSAEAKAYGMGMTYTWQAQPKSSDPDTGEWYVIENISDSTTYYKNTITFSNVSGTWEDNGYALRNSDNVIFDPADARFRCRVHTLYGEALSETAELRVIPDPVFSQHPQKQIVEAGRSANFTAEATGAEAITYTWQAQPKSSDPDTGEWYDIWYQFGLVGSKHEGPNLPFSNVSGTWAEQDNKYYLADEDGYRVDSSFEPAEARFRCVATDDSGRVGYSTPAELIVVNGGGTDGREVELRSNGTYVQWRYAGEDDTEWRDLVALSAITGGDGREIQLQVANGY
ncbi:MAG: hypothetical protein ACLRPX_08760, partial [Ruthenibacterium sp.]